MIGGVPVGMQMPGQGGMLALPSAQARWPGGPVGFFWKMKELIASVG